MSWASLSVVELTVRWMMDDETSRRWMSYGASLEREWKLPVHASRYRSMKHGGILECLYESEWGRSVHGSRSRREMELSQDVV